MTASEALTSFIKSWESENGKIRLPKIKRKKVLVIGCPGAGKTTFATKLSSKVGLPLYHLDLFWWKADRTTVSIDEFDRCLHDILVKEEWISMDFAAYFKNDYLG